MAFDNVNIISLRNGATSITGARQDLVAGEVITLSLSSYTGVSSRRWEIIGRPEGSAAGGGGVNPWVLGTGTTSTFTVDADALPFRVDGTYTVSCVLNAGSPTERRITSVLSRLTGLTIAASGGGTLPLRKLGGFESLEDTINPGGGVIQGWATMLNRWLEYMRGIAISGGTTLRASYELGTSVTDQTLPMTNAKGHLVLDASAAGASALPYALSILGQSGATVRATLTGAILASGGLGSGAATEAGVLALQSSPSAAVSAVNTGRLRYNDGASRLEYSVDGGAWTAFGTGGGGTETLRQAYQAGAVALDQTLPLTDADGGGVIIDGTAAGFTGTMSLNVLGNSSRGLRVHRSTGRVVVDAVESTTTTPTKTFTVVDSGNSSRFPTIQLQDHDDGIWAYNLEWQGDTGSSGQLKLTNPDVTRSNRVIMDGTATASIVQNQFLLQNGATVIGGLENYRSGLGTTSPYQQDAMVLRAAQSAGLNIVNENAAAFTRFWNGGARTGAFSSIVQSSPLTGVYSVLTVGGSTGMPGTSGSEIIVRNIATNGLSQGTKFSSQFIDGQVWSLFSPSNAVAANCGTTWEFVYNGSFGTTTTLTGNRPLILSEELSTLPLGLRYSDQQEYAISADQNNYSPVGKLAISINPTGALRSITGYAFAGAEGNLAGRVLILTNVSTSQNLVIVHQSGASTAANQFVCPGSADLTLPPGGSSQWRYDATASRWRCIGTAGVSGGGGGGGSTLLAAYQAGTGASDQTLPILDSDGGGVVLNGSGAGFTGADTLVFNVRGSSDRGLRVRRADGRVVVDNVESVTTVPTKTFTIVDNGASTRYPTLQFRDVSTGNWDYNIEWRGNSAGTGKLRLSNPDTSRVNNVTLVGQNTGYTERNILEFYDGSQIGKISHFGGGGISGSPYSSYNFVVASTDAASALVLAATGSGSIKAYVGGTGNDLAWTTGFAASGTGVVHNFNVVNNVATLEGGSEITISTGNAGVGTGYGVRLNLVHAGGHSWKMWTAANGTAVDAGKELIFSDGGTTAMYMDDTRVFVPKGFVPEHTFGASINADQNNYNPAGYFAFNITPTTAPRTITGWLVGTANTPGRVIVVNNVSATIDLVIANESASSTTTNQFSLPGAVSLTLSPGNGAIFRYNSTTSRWLCISSTLTAGSSGGITLTQAQVAFGDTAPNTIIGTSNFSYLNIPAAELNVSGSTSSLISIEAGGAANGNDAVLALQNDNANLGVGSNKTGPHITWLWTSGSYHRWRMVSETPSNGRNLSIGIHDPAVAGSLYPAITFNGDVAGPTGSQVVAQLAGGVALTNTVSATSIASNQNDYSPGDRGNSFIRLTSSVDVWVTGLQMDAGVANNEDGTLAVIANIGTKDILLKHEHTSSTDTNRFKNHGALDIHLSADATVLAFYDGVSDRWRIIGADTLWALSVPADDFRSTASTDWNISAPAELRTCPSNTAKQVLAFDPTTEESAGLPDLHIPRKSSGVIIRHSSRPATAPTGAGNDGVVVRLHLRKISDAGTFGTWLTYDLPTFTFPTNTNWKNVIEEVPYSALSTVPVPGENWQWMVSRRVSASGDDLAGDWFLGQMTFDFV